MIAIEMERFFKKKFIEQKCTNVNKNEKRDLYLQEDLLY